MFFFVVLVVVVVIVGCGGLLFDLMLVLMVMFLDVVMVDVNIQVVWVEIGDSNQVVVCVVISYMNSVLFVDSLVCLLLMVDGIFMCMMLCVVVGIFVQCIMVSVVSDLKVLFFFVNVCEVIVVFMVKVVLIGLCLLLLFKVNLQCVVILVDIGCCMKKLSNMFQLCNDLLLWLFVSVVVMVVKMNFDFVLYVGDYYYCENVCLFDVVGCQGSFWGYGWDVWQVDLFQFVVLLMVVVLWVLVCGNYEECVCVGQGWYCFLDLCLYLVDCLCDNLVNDMVVNVLDLYVVVFGSDMQVIVFDLVKVGMMVLVMIDLWFQIYQKQFSMVGMLVVKLGVMLIFINYYLILGFVFIVGSMLLGGNVVLLLVMNSLNVMVYYLLGVQVVFYGYVYDFQVINFISNYLVIIVVGNVGDLLDVVLFDLFLVVSLVLGVMVGSILYNNLFGFMVMDCQFVFVKGWLFKVYIVVGKLLMMCMQNGISLVCDKMGFVVF